ncbi:MAG: DUF1015 domain-containing protein [Armatimonadetes bacterium]|nr:DUF1015 domain-containing protein [Armatimonadota bacterium]
MALIKPFNGIRYNQAKVGDLSAVVTPPYDVISPEEEEFYLQQHPNNIVRLILPRKKSSADNYSHAAELLRSWLNSGVLIREEKPCIYACIQEFELDGKTRQRLGITCLVRLEDFESKTILPHENILTKPLEDRLNLIRATRANFDSIFGLHSDGYIGEILKPFLARPPDASARDKDGVKCDLYCISDHGAIMAISETLAQKPILIADGHHRYSAALAYRNEMRTTYGGCASDAPYEFIMMTLVSLEDKGLVILPTHRLVRNVKDFNPESFLSQLSELFEVTKTPTKELEQTVSIIGKNRTAFGLYLGNANSYVIRIKPDVRPEKLIQSPGSDALKRLDVSILHSLILEKILGIGNQQFAAGTNVSYTRDIPNAMRLVDKGEYQAFFLINPTKVEEVKEIASTGERMPQKSTFFYPKLLTGMVLRVME